MHAATGDNHLAVEELVGGITGGDAEEVVPLCTDGCIDRLMSLGRCASPWAARMIAN